MPFYSDLLRPLPFSALLQPHCELPFQKGNQPFWYKSYRLDEPEFLDILEFWTLLDEDRLMEFGYKPNDKAIKGEADEPKSISPSQLQNFMNLPTRVVLRELKGLQDGSTKAKALALYTYHNPGKPVPSGNPYPVTKASRVDRKVLIDYLQKIGE